AGGDWQAHLGAGPSVFVNAATWGLVVTGHLLASETPSSASLGATLTRLIGRAGEPVIRRAVDVAMRLMGAQFVTGETIAEALKRARKLEAQGFAYSYDMLGEAATTAADAARYLADYEGAIHAIGQASAGRGIHAGPGISIKLSALHPRYARAQAARVMAELLPRVRALALLAKRYDIGLNIDAEEADRLEISLDLLEALALDAELAGWNGLGFVVQAYGKRCPFVIDWLVDLAHRAGRRIMVRLVKGAYWDSEIKRAQSEGLADFPVYTRKIHTDVAYIACARKLLAARGALFPQFATHNAQTLASIYHLAGPDFTPGDYEFQCLHGMGEPLYEQVVGAARLNRPCRIYAPVGTHETLLAYLVRRLLENGANSSFVHRIWDASLSPEALAEDPVAAALQVAPVGAPHPLVALPGALYGPRANAAGLDLADETTLAALSAALQASAAQGAQALPEGTSGPMRPITNPADRRCVVGHVREACAADIAPALARAEAAFPAWAALGAGPRAALLERAATAMESAAPRLIDLAIREAGKTAANAVAELREAVDFLRYYAAEARRTLSAATPPLGPVACISPWNFPLAIFTGQVAAALVAGNTVLAKPAEETPLMAAEAVRLLHAAGIPADVLQLLPGDGAVGAGLVAHEGTAAVLFTGSTEVARLIQRQLAARGLPQGRAIPLIAETGGQNAMIVDSSALAEQVTADVLASAFDSAGQRCSALRVLCLQEDIAERQLAMIRGALAEQALGQPDALATDIGPVISEEARAGIEAHVARMAAAGCAITRLPLPADCAHGSFVAPTLIEITDIAEIGGEVFGPVLHVLRYPRAGLAALVEAINATGYGLTFGLHTRLDETVAQVTQSVAAGNLYVNRNMIGAVVGVQPFGGRGLSGTGPKAGGPLYLGRLVAARPAAAIGREGPLAGHRAELPGPVGERNLYALHPRGAVLALAHTAAGLEAQIAAALAEGNVLQVLARPGLALVVAAQPASRVQLIERLPETSAFAAALVEAGPNAHADLIALAAMAGAIPLTQVSAADGTYRADWLVEEQTVSINTTAAGGNASLMALV
ncbi:MAG TPA: bifunctional proline dehydrogenase/L-glutamate gamma-semialdehyde dehydrogenase PutA, partial [Novosphingobium sp.]|nr:bifunctional proline dehydrogenase/L-glutamate gamma-semialdehyde dehydrogenase PutA [Novosphingobium sp.]